MRARHDPGALAIRIAFTPGADVFPPTYFIRKQTIVDAIARSHLSHQLFAERIGMSRAYWSQVFNGHRPVSPAARRALLSCSALKGIPESDLWTITYEAVAA